MLQKKRNLYNEQTSKFYGVISTDINESDVKFRLILFVLNKVVSLVPKFRAALEHFRLDFIRFLKFITALDDCFPRIDRHGFFDVLGLSFQCFLDIGYLK